MSNQDDYQEMLGVIMLDTALPQERVESMLRALIAKGWTITRVSNLKTV